MSSKIPQAPPCRQCGKVPHMRMERGSWMPYGCNCTGTNRPDCDTSYEEYPQIDFTHSINEDNEIEYDPNRRLTFVDGLIAGFLIGFVVGLLVVMK
jgi:hypothetical protein